MNNMVLYFCLLVHLRPKACGRAICIPVTFVYSSICLSTFSNIFSETTGPIDSSLKWRLSLLRVFESLFNAHMTQMVAMPIYGKTL